jgi:predicted cupin superfamily sugar epimerase
MSQDLSLLSSPASELVDKLELEEHFEGGFFKQTEAIQDGGSNDWPCTALAEHHMARETI